MQRVRAEMPTEPGARAQRWIELNGPFIVERLKQMRFSQAQPWLVTHTVAEEQDSAAQEIWGVDLAGLTTQWIQRRGLDVVVELPAPALLGRGPLVGDMALNVARTRPGQPYDAAERARYVAAWAIERLAKAITKDIDGARLVVSVGGAATPETK
jgi:hypothetical protein